MNERLEATVRGRVQGVGFRWFVERQAARLRVVGWASNESDGSVKVVAEGSPAALDELLAELWRGPPGADIAQVDHQQLAPTGEFERFGTRSSGHRGD